MREIIILILLFIITLIILAHQVKSAERRRESPFMSAQWKRRMLKEAHRQKGKNGSTLR